MLIYFYPLNSLDDLEAALHPGCKQVGLFTATPQHGWQVVLTQVNDSNALGVVLYVQDYFPLTSYAVLYEINEADPGGSTNK